MAKRLTVEEARKRVIENLQLTNCGKPSMIQIQKAMVKYAVYRDLDANDPMGFDEESLLISKALCGDPAADAEPVPEVEIQEEPVMVTVVTEAVEVEEVETIDTFQAPVIQEPDPVAVIVEEVEEAPQEEAPKASTMETVAQGAAKAAKAAKIAGHAAITLIKLALMAGKASLPWVVKGAKALYSLALMVIYSSLDVADAIKTWAPFGAHKVQGWVVYSLIPGARKAARATRRAGSVALEIIVAGSRQAAGIAIVAALVAVKAGAAMVQGATVVAGGCKAGWQMRQEIIDEEREAA